MTISLSHSLNSCISCSINIIKEDIVCGMVFARGALVALSGDLDSGDLALGMDLDLVLDVGFGKGC